MVVRGIVAVGYTRGSGWTGGGCLECRDELAVLRTCTPFYSSVARSLDASQTKGLVLASTLALQVLRRVLSVIAMRICLYHMHFCHFQLDFAYALSKGKS